MSGIEREDWMLVPLQISFRHMAPSPAVEARIRRHVRELEHFYHRINSCHVVVESTHRRHLQGNLFQIHIDITVPGGEIAIARDPELHSHEDVYVAIRDAFAAARRRLEDHARLARGDVKQHLVPDHGAVARLLPERDCGFIADAAGNEIYFHRNSVADDGFDRLAIGDEVRFVAREGESAQGPQASSVTPIGKHHLPPAEAVRG
jgi:cold shock CspA family protein/ribosome-associated translation inhibitor RaiA